MRRIVQSLGFAYEQLVVDPAMVRISLIGQLIVSGNDDAIRAGNRREILSTPGISFDDRHRYATRRRGLTPPGGIFLLGLGICRLCYDNLVLLLLGFCRSPR